MNALASSSDLFGLAALAFVLGLRHGVDADHLAAIDAMTRFNASARPRLARLTGLCFSLGHGAVVLAVAFAVASMAHARPLPAWLAPLGAWVSIAVLMLLGVLNLRAVRRAPPQSAVALAGWRSSLFGRVLKASGPWAITGVGALFAVSFDTLSQAALMAVTGTAMQGPVAVGMLAGAFVVGMALADGLNGWFVASLVRRSERQGARLSRIMALSVGGVSIGTALLGATAQASAAADAWVDLHQGGLAIAILGIVTVAFLAARWLAGRGPLQPQGSGMSGLS